MSKSPYDELVPDDGSPKSQPQENDDMNGKPLRKSKTFWINLITAVAGIATAVGGSDLVQQNPEYAGIAATVLGVVNIFMRFVTKEPVSGV